jgi:hypothetical protein
MPDVYYQSPINFPQTAQNRTRAQAKEELAEFAGGGNKPDTLVRAGRSWDAAVREFNVVGWRFNRVQADITLVAGTKTYELPTEFRTPVRAQLVDSNDAENYTLEWIPYERWQITFDSQRTGAGCPEGYTALNIHGTGLVRYEPFPAGTLSYPTVRHTYLKRIALATTDGDRLDVPVEVDEAIFQLALAFFISKQRSFDDAQQIFVLAKTLRLECEREHRHWIEESGWGATG